MIVQLQWWHKRTLFIQMTEGYQGEVLGGSSHPHLHRYGALSWIRREEGQYYALRIFADALWEWKLPVQLKFTQSSVQLGNVVSLERCCAHQHLIYKVCESRACV